MAKSYHLVVGLGKTGLSIAKFLHKRDKLFILFDTRVHVEDFADFKSRFPDVEIFLNILPKEVYPKLCSVILSPGVALDAPFLEEIRRRSIPICGDIECFAREVTSFVIAITGTNGKSTVTTLVGEMAKASGLSVAVAGNIGLPVLDLLDDGKHYDLWVLELSGFQLDLTESLKPQAATILNISPDHLDRHHSLEAYAIAKQRIYNQAQFLLYNRDDEQTYPLARGFLLPNGHGSDSSAEMMTVAECSYGLNPPDLGQWGVILLNGNYWIAHGSDVVISVDSMRIKGKHNWANAIAAMALANSVGITPDSCISVLKSFAGLPHRCQWVRKLDQVDWINDSKGTNTGASIAAINGLGDSIGGKIVLIAGGCGKGADFEVLQGPAREHLRVAVLIGQDAQKLERALSDIIPVLHAGSMLEAVKFAKGAAIAGDIVLLSPACASYDMFDDFNHRGEVFMQAVDSL